MNNLAIVVLAAGKGKRMNNPDLPKVMCQLLDKPLISHVIFEAQKLQPKKIIIIVGHKKEKVIDYINNLGIDNVAFAEQNLQLGTGHAVAQASHDLTDFDGDVLILCGDVPLLKYSTLEKFISNHNEKKATVSVLSAIVDDSHGYGRIVRNEDGEFIKIVEEKDSNDNEKLINEINSGVFIVNAKELFTALESVSNKNAQGEYYLTDIAEIIRSNGKIVVAYPGADPDELLGVNSPEQLRKAEELFIKLQG